MHKCTETQQKPHPQAVQNNKKLQKPNKKTRKTTAAPKEQKNRISHPPQTIRQRAPTQHRQTVKAPTTTYNKSITKKHKSNTPHNNRDISLNTHTTRKKGQIQTASHKPVTNYNKKLIIGKHYLQIQFY